MPGFLTRIKRYRNLIDGAGGRDVPQKHSPKTDRSFSEERIGSKEKLKNGEPLSEHVVAAKIDLLNRLNRAWEEQHRTIQLKSFKLGLGHERDSFDNL